ncbi:DENN domain-containing protein 1C isoform X1 [Pelobates fuscus]|uniref:DENN domain-containing protein 1C isoform X1 n=1 Tax=Pelobates fuscus TaxID=191477 RepID=UPI002FE45DBB
MGSRIKENPERIFDGFFEVLHPESVKADPILKRQFPEHLEDQDSYAALAQFCFPFDKARWQNSSVQHFSFTLTDLQGYQRLGFCRLSIQAKSCICILSCLPWFELFYKLLNNIAEYLAKEQFNEVDLLLQALYQHPVPEINTALSLEMLSHFITPDPTRLPSIPENRNLTEFMVAVHVDTMLQLYSSLLYERRILITCTKLSTLTACVHASAALLYPMYWQHIYIPTLPPHLLDYIGAPMPYLIGVHSSLMEQMNTKTMEEVVIFNVDTNSLETPFQDLQNLPPNVVSLLKLRLRKQSALMGDGVSKVFLKAQAMLFGGYRDALICTPGEPISFCQESFLNNKCSAMRGFLQNAVHLQLFNQFIDSRLEKLNAGDGFTDIFEQEITNCGLSGNSKSYQLWLDNIKKGSGSLINNVKTRAHPAVRNMLRYAKGQARSGLQGMRSRMKQKEQRQLHRGGSLRGDGGLTQNHEKLQSRLPITQHFGQSRPKRPGKRYMESDSWESQSHPQEETGKESEVVAEAEDEFPLMEDQGMDLLDEIFETLNTRAPGEERALYGTHSLDFFNLDDSQYFTRFQSISPTSEEDLSISQPRDSCLWYLQEEDEGSLDETNTSPEPTSLTSDSTSMNIEDISQTTNDIPPSVLVASPISEIILPTTKFTLPSLALNDTSEIQEVTTLAEARTSLENEVKLLTKEVALLSKEDTLPTEDIKAQVNMDIPTQKVEVISLANVVTSQIKDNPATPESAVSSTGSSTKTPENIVPVTGISSTPESVVPATITQKSATTEGPTPNHYKTTEKDTECTNQGASYSVSGPSVRTTLSRFQSGPLDPRLMWPGTKKDAAQKVIHFINQQQKNNPQTPCTLNMIPRNTSNSKLKMQSDLSPTTNNPKSIQALNANASISIPKRERVDQEVSPESADLRLKSLPKVSELKKRFEV